MLPKFPEFKSLELSDREEIEKLTADFEPYSDFDFISMWSWDIQGRFKVSELNDNLVVVLTDHFTDEPFYSILGNNEINASLKQIFAFPLSNSLYKDELRLVPEISLEGIDLNKYLIEIDLNNYDYIFDLSEHVKYEGAKFASKRKLYNRFLRDHPEAVVRILDLGIPNDSKLVLALAEEWMVSKTNDMNGVNLVKEFLAIKKFLSLSLHNVLCVGVFIGQKLIGCEVFAITGGNYAISHFAKTLPKFTGLYEYQVSKSAEMLLQKGVKFLNAEEDLGLESLRFSKNSYRPIKFLKKFSIREK